MPALAAAVLIGVVSIVDGDTLDMHGQRIRLWGIDSPESGQTCRLEGEPVRCGTTASNALDQFIAGRTLQCEPVAKDRYNRTVARCEVGGVSVNAWLVVNGYAVEYPQYSKGAYTAYQDQAKAQRRGVWATQFDMPWDWRHRNKD